MVFFQPVPYLTATHHLFQVLGQVSQHTEVMAGIYRGSSDKTGGLFILVYPNENRFLAPANSSSTSWSPLFIILTSRRNLDLLKF
jgi:hypothetical protein